MRLKTIIHAISSKDLADKRKEELKDEHTDPMRKAELSISAVMSIITIIAFFFVFVKSFH